MNRKELQQVNSMIEEYENIKKTLYHLNNIDFDPTLSFFTHGISINIGNFYTIGDITESLFKEIKQTLINNKEKYEAEFRRLGFNYNE